MWKIEWSCNGNVLGGGEFAVKRVALKEWDILRTIAINKGLKCKLVLVNPFGEIERKCTFNTMLPNSKK